MSELDDTIQTGGPAYARDESPAHRLDRNYAELLQEMRVVGTGVQVFFGFLLAVAFQPRFATVDGLEKATYLVTLLAAATAIVLLVAPVVFHRMVFRRRQKDDLVRWTARFSLAGIVALAVAVLGSVLLVCSWVVGRSFAIVTTAVMGTLLAGLWFVLPLRYRWDHDVAHDPIGRG